MVDFQKTFQGLGLLEWEKEILAESDPRGYFLEDFVDEFDLDRKQTKWLYIQLAQYLLGFKLILEKKFHENRTNSISQRSGQKQKEAIACVSGPKSNRIWMECGSGPDGIRYSQVTNPS